MKLLGILVSLVLATSASAAPAAGLIDIGVAAAVRGSVKAAAPGQPPAGRVVETGKQVYSRDKVTVGADSRLQVLLLDQTSFTMGPNSEMTLDEFVYDPNTSAGKVAASVAKGAFRFVTGKVARKDPASMKVALPVGTIGIRGTMCAGTVGAGEATVALLGPGPENNADEKQGGITVKNDLGSVEVDQDGWGVVIKQGQPPSAPFKLTQAQLDGLMAGLSPAPGGGSEGAGPIDGDDSSGQKEAEGKIAEGDAFAAIDAQQGETGLFASQQLAAPGKLTWDDVRGVAGGQGKYVGSGPFYLCTNGCGGSALGTTTFSLLVDFGAKTLGGGGSASQITLTAPASTTANINQFSYAGFTGDAKINLAPNIAGATWTGTTLELLNSGGQTAGAATIDVRWNTGIPPTYGGPVTGPLE